jgi:hypothetical protein
MDLEEVFFPRRGISRLLQPSRSSCLLVNKGIAHRKLWKDGKKEDDLEKIFFFVLSTSLSLRGASRIPLVSHRLKAEL